ncbi:uroporphyrinogen-III C-methyltransferase [Chitinibacteraceae bacterium HSL-7]
MTQSSDSFSSTLESPARPAPAQPSSQGLSIALAVAALAASGGLWLYQQHVVRQQEIDVAKVLSAKQEQLVQITTHAAQLDERTRVLERELNTVNTKQTEALTQQAALASMYERLTRDETERALIDVERMLSLVSQQLQLTGDVPGALAALETIEGQLAGANRAELIPVREALVHDIDRLKTLPYVDVVSVSTRLDQMVRNVDTLPLAIDVTPAKPEAKPARSDSRVRDLLSEFWAELSSLVRVREMDKPQALLLSPEQSFVLREHIKLRLLSARNSVQLRHGASFSEDIAAVKVYLRDYFDDEAGTVKHAQTELDRLAKLQLNAQLPTLRESLTAIRNARSAQGDAQ